MFIGDAGKSADVAEKVKKYGAEKVYVVDDARDQGLPGGPEGRGAAAAGREDRRRDAILIPSSFEGKEIAARLAIKIESGLITDAVDVQAATAVLR